MIRLTRMRSERLATSALLLVLAATAAGCSTRSSQDRSPRPSPPAPPRSPPPAQAEIFDPGQPPTQAGSAYLFLPGSVTRQLVNFYVQQGHAVLEGDILLGPVASVPFRYGFAPPAGGNVKGAVATTVRSHLWPGGVIPYEIPASATDAERHRVEWAAGHVSETLLTIRPRAPADRDYVVFEFTGGCSSYVGRAGGPQPIKASCSAGSIAHEMLHTAGVYHEQSRSDRDEYVTVNFDEIVPSARSNFDKHVADAQDIGPYDYDSIMHYPPTAFSRTGSPTLVPRDPSAQIGQRDGLSAGDRAGIAELYRGMVEASAPAASPSPAPAPAPQAPPTVQRPAPTPAPPPPATGPVARTGFAGRYTSENGDVTCTESGSTVNCAFSLGTMMCASNGARLDCIWTGSGSGRATFQREPSGVLSGTWGDFFSNDSRGAWRLAPPDGAPSAPTPGPVAPSTAPAAPPTQPAPGGQPVSLAGSYDSSRGPLSCTESGASLSCTFDEGGAPGRLDCTKDASGLSLGCSWMTFLPRPGAGRARFGRPSVASRSLTGSFGYLTSDENAGAWTATPR